MKIFLLLTMKNKIDNNRNKTPLEKTGQESLKKMDS